MENQTSTTPSEVNQKGGAGKLEIPAVSGIASAYFRITVRMFPECCPYVAEIGVRIAPESAVIGEKLHDNQSSIVTKREKKFSNYHIASLP